MMVVFCASSPLMLRSMSAAESISKDSIRSRGFTEGVGAAGVIP